MQVEEKLPWENENGLAHELGTLPLRRLTTEGTLPLRRLAEPR